jgi:hypothetical protein
MVAEFLESTHIPAYGGSIRRLQEQTLGDVLNYDVQKNLFGLALSISYDTLTCTTIKKFLYNSRNGL